MSSRVSKDRPVNLGLNTHQSEPCGAAGVFSPTASGILDSSRSATILAADSGSVAASVALGSTGTSSGFGLSKLS